PDLRQCRHVRRHRCPAGGRPASDDPESADRRPVHRAPGPPAGTAARAALAYDGRRQGGSAARDYCRAGNMALMVEGRVRLDQALVAQGLVPSRQRAQAMVRAGLVRVAEAVADRPDQMVDPAVSINLDRVKAYVSRGGDKLAAALDAFGIDPSGRVCLDLGASTGCFTDLLLQRGAAGVV